MPPNPDFPYYWTDETSTSPSARERMAMVYDSANEYILAFGGFDNATAQTDTWTYDGDWHHLTPATTPLNQGSLLGLAFDEIREEAVLTSRIYVGPGIHDYVFHTYVWDGTNWIEKFPATSPTWDAWNPIRFVFDKTNGYCLQFGGQTTGSTNAGTDYTWKWDGTTWTQLFPSTTPTPATLGGMAFDDYTGKIIMWGGVDHTNSAVKETWTWDGTDWTLETTPNSDPNANPQLLEACAVYWATIDRLIMIPEGDGFSMFTWEGTDWEPVIGIDTSLAYGYRNSFTAAELPTLDTVFVFGGRDGSGNVTASDKYLLKFPHPDDPATVAGKYAYYHNGEWHIMEDLV